MQKIEESHGDWAVRLWSEGDLDWLQNHTLYATASTYAGKANIARYEIVYRYGGYYFDSDFEILKGFEDPGWPKLGLVVAAERKGLFNNALFAAPKGHPFIGQLVAALPESFETYGAGSSQLVTGPHFFTRELARWSRTDANEFVEIHRDLVYPYSFDKPDREAGPWAPSALAVHHWHQARSGPAWSQTPSHYDRIRFFLKRPLRAARRILRALRESYREWKFRRTWTPLAATLPDGKILTVTRRRTPIAMLASDLNTVGFLLTYGDYDAVFHKFLRRVLSGSDVYVDVGANIGQFVLTAASQLSPYGRVFAYEPNPEARETLETNVYMQRNLGMISAEVAVRAVALGDFAGKESLTVPRFHAGRASMSPYALQDIPDVNLREVDVNVATLDEDLGFLSHIRLLKVDVEGAEWRVLTGSRVLVESGRVDFIDIEVIGAHLGPDIQQLISLAQKWMDLGAELASIKRDGTLAGLAGDAASILNSRDWGHLIIDARGIAARLNDK